MKGVIQFLWNPILILGRQSYYKKKLSLANLFTLALYITPRESVTQGPTMPPSAMGSSPYTKQIRHPHFGISETVNFLFSCTTEQHKDQVQ